MLKWKNPEKELIVKSHVSTSESVKLYHQAVRDFIYPPLKWLITKDEVSRLLKIEEKGMDSALGELRKNHQELLRQLCIKNNVNYPELMTSLRLFSEENFEDDCVFRIKLANIMAPNQVHHVVLILGDITKIPADVIVNSANKSLLAGSGVCGALHKAAGPKLEKECQELKAQLNIKFLKTGDHIVTNAYKLPAKWVIHTVGPKHNENILHEGIKMLRWCYIRSIVNADDLGAASISFPAISTGNHKISIQESAESVKLALLKDLPRLLPITNVREIKLIFNKRSDFEAYKKAFSEETITSN